MTRWAGIETLGSSVLGRGFSTWALTTPAIVSGSMPLARAWAKAASRSGPWVPVVAACFSTWQVPHFWMNSWRPRSESPVSLTPQPAQGHEGDPGEGERRAPCGSRPGEDPSRHEAGILSSASAGRPRPFGVAGAFG